jgi:hypothetical protein
MDELERLRKENTILRGLIQCNPDWKCTYGHQIQNMAQCPQGFPGCGCGDDLLCAYCEPPAMDTGTKPEAVSALVEAESPK